MFYTVHLYDEAPAIGQGVRCVFIESKGPKHTKVRCPYTLVGAAIRAADWMAIERRARPAVVKAGTIKRSVKRVKARTTKTKDKVIPRKMLKSEKKAASAMLAAIRGVA